MKKIFLPVLLLLSTITYSQELDEAFLESLPENIRQDMKGKIDAKAELEKPVYRSASTFVDKAQGYKSPIFGSDFFDIMQTSFMPINEPNLDASYILDFGDALEIQLIGQKDLSDTYIIARDGSINLPDIGKLNLSGLSLSDASDLIKTKVNNSYIGTSAFISLKNVRDINILIVGNAFNPGIYTLNGNSNMLHALSMAGGINDIGSYRDISLVRSGKIIDTLDIYEVLIYGKYNFSIGLRSGDSIVVNPRKRLVSFESGVMRPAIYELKEGENFEDLLKFANGFKKNNDFSNIIVKRILSGNINVIKLKMDDLDSFKLLANDSIFIREFKIDTIRIEGSVKNPGTYKLPRGSTLSEAILIAGGYDSSAYTFGGYLENDKALKVNKEAKEKLYQAFITNLITNSSHSSVQTSGIQQLLFQIKESKSTGRVIAEFDLDLIAKEPSLDTILEDGDKLIIPQITQQIYVQGEVANPGAIRYEPGMNIDYYLSKSGGVLINGDMDNLFIVHPNGETENLSSKSRLSFIIAENDKQLIYPGSILYIPQKTNLTNSLQVASIWAPIISSIALSLTSLSVLNNSN
jgi:protein involved in polysaccharide export with SLBB domain